MPTRRAARTIAPDLTEMAAAEFIERHGPAGLAILKERADLADELGHKFAAQTWRSMADAAARLLRMSASHPVRSQPAGPVAQPVARRH
jgi:hypothetical protein